MNEYDLVFISSPFTHADKETVDRRVKITSEVAARLILARVNAMSPIAYGEPFVRAGLIETNDWSFWEHFCVAILRKCSAMYILDIEGWKESTGVAGEIRVAMEMNIPIFIMDPETLTFVDYYSTKEKCDCGKMATYILMSSSATDKFNPYFCDEHVPRGCSCNNYYVSPEAYHPPLEKPSLPTEEDKPYKWVEEGKVWTHVDEQGREYPCVEFDYEEFGFDKD